MTEGYPLEGGATSPERAESAPKLSIEVTGDQLAALRDPQNGRIEGVRKTGTPISELQIGQRIEVTDGTDVVEGEVIAKDPAGSMGGMDFYELTLRAVSKDTE